MPPGLARNPACGRTRSFPSRRDTIHPAILPFHRKRAAIADVVQRHDDFLKIDVAVTERTEIPKAARVGEIRVTAEHATVPSP